MIFTKILFEKVDFFEQVVYNDFGVKIASKRRKFLNFWPFEKVYFFGQLIMVNNLGVNLQWVSEI